MNRRRKRPDHDPITQVQLRVQKAMPKPQGQHADHEAWKRRVSTKVAAELRRLGLIDEEGYAPGSWAAP